MKNLTFPLALLLLVLTSCKDDTASAVQNDELDVAQASERFIAYLQEQWDLDLADSPMMQTSMGVKDDYGTWDDMSPLSRKRDLTKAKERLNYLKLVDTTLLEDQDYLSYRLYKKQQQDIIEGDQWHDYDYPFNQMHGAQAEIPAFLINMHSINDVTDADAYISRLEQMNLLFSQLTDDLKTKHAAGITPPRFVFDKVLSDARNVIDGRPFTPGDDSTLLQDFRNKVNALDFDEETKQDLISRASEALLSGVKPGFDNLITTLERLREEATDDAGVWKFPNGADYYNYALRQTTTTDMTAAQIHQLGLDEVARIHDEMRAIMKQVGYTGTLQEFFEFMRKDKQFYYADDEAGRAAYLAEAVKTIDNMKGDLDKLFNIKPKADIIVKAVEPFREASSGKAFYQQPAIDGSRPGTYYANLYKMEAMPKYQLEALAFHEGIPGHHMQIAIAQELEGVPDFRKFSFNTAYIEGWGLYSELVPKEIGYYSDPYSDFGRLAMELWRACRLVVDTGIHAQKWTREEGIEYYVSNTPNAESDAIKMVERHIVMPSQATAYKVGMIKILELRNKAKEALGDNFDIRDFHDVILQDGSLPLDILEEQVDKYIEANKV